MSDDLTALASAYVDGELTADERARVEADAELTAEVERLRQVRAALSQREQPSISMREQHLATALSAWDALSADARPGESWASSTPASGVRRRGVSSTAWLGLAAAGLVIVVGAGFVLNSVNGNTGNTGNSGDAAAPASNVARSAAPTDAAASADAKAAPDVAGQVAESGTAPLPGPEVNTDIGVAAPPPEIGDLAQLSGPDDLAAFASSALAAPSAAQLPKGATLVTEVPTASDPVPAAAGSATAGAGSALKKLAELPRCGGVDQVVGLAAYRGTEVVVGIDDNRHLAIASRQKDCSEVAQAPLP